MVFMGLSLRAIRAGNDITSFPHLPAATDFHDLRSLGRVGDEDLARLIFDCAAWRLQIDDFGSRFYTPAAMTEWRVHYEGEIELVHAAIERLKAEVKARSDRLCGNAAGEELEC